MTLNYFKPSDLMQIDATFNYMAKTGIGFAILPTNEQVFVTARDVDMLKLSIGDSIRVWAVDNYASPETAHFTSRWRAVRVEVVERVSDAVRHTTNIAPAATPAPAAPEPEPAPHSTDFVGVVAQFMAESRAWTPNELAHAVAKFSPPLAALPDLLPKVAGRLTTLHKNGEAACVKVYARGDQERASAIYYAKNVDVIYDHLDTPLGDE